MWFLFSLALPLNGFELQFATTSSVGSVVSYPRLVHSSFLRNLSTTRDRETPYITAMRPRIETLFGYFFGTFVGDSISPGSISSSGKWGKQAFFMWGIQEAHVWGEQWGGT